MAVRIFVAGSSSKNVELAKDTFAHLGYEIIPVNGVALGLFLAHKNFPHVIVSDLKMIDGSGLEFLTEVKQDPDLSTIPFIFLCSDECTKDAKDEAAALGAVKMLSHPISSDELFAELRPYLREREDEREPDTPE